MNAVLFKLSNEELFFNLFNCHTEEDITNVIDLHSDYFKQENWFPLGGNENNYGVIENQQASPDQFNDPSIGPYFLGMLQKILLIQISS